MGVSNAHPKQLPQTTHGNYAMHCDKHNGMIYSGVLVRAALLAAII